MLTLSDISKRLKLSTSTIRALIDKRLLKASDVGTGRNRCYRVSEEDLAEFLDSRSSQRKSNEPIQKGKRIEVKQIV